MIFLGKIVNTHGIKGEVRIISDFKYKDSAFKIGNKLRVDNEELIVKAYRKHKQYDMIVFDGINNINDVLKYKGKCIYIDKENLKYDGYLNEEIIGLDVYDNNVKVGKVTDIYKSKLYDLLVISGKTEHLVPNTDVFVKKIDIKNNAIYINYIKGLNNED